VIATLAPAHHTPRKSQEHRRAPLLGHRHLSSGKVLRVLKGVEGVWVFRVFGWCLGYFIGWCLGCFTRVKGFSFGLMVEG
jgi:hypothetical protein